MHPSGAAFLSFLRLCREFSGPEFAQGFGGNISVKLGRGRMLVKSSGVELAKVGKRGGFAEVDHRMIANAYSPRRRISEKAASAIARSSRAIGSLEKPSMETGFHSFLGKYVLHLHPVHLNVILCQRDAGRILREAFPGRKIIFVPYAAPGHALANAVKKKTKAAKECVIFLQNHGVIISSQSAAHCRRIMLEIERKSIKHLKSNIQNFTPFKMGAKNRKAIISAPAMFPDAALFLRNANLSNPAIAATLSANLFISKNSRLLGKPRRLSHAEEEALFCSSDEKHRLKKAGV